MTYTNRAAKLYYIEAMRRTSFNYSHARMRMELNSEYQVQPRVHRHLQKALADGHAALLSSSFAIS